MKILHVYFDFPPDSYGGVESAIEYYLGVDDFFETTSSVLYLGKESATYKFGRSKIHSIKRLVSILGCPIGGYSFISRVFAEAKDVDKVIIHTPWPFGNLLGILLTLFSRKRFIIYYHADIIRQKWLNFAISPFIFVSLLISERVFSSSKKYARSSATLSLLSRVVSGKVSIAPISVTADFEKRLKELRGGVCTGYSCSSRFSHLMLEAEPFVLFIGSPRHYKGIETLKRLPAKLHRFVVVAGGTEECWSTYALPESFRFYPRISQAEKLQLITNASALLLPSTNRAEAYGVCLVEALYCGTPIITTEIDSGNTYICRHERNGLVIPPGDSTALADAISKILFSEPEYQRRLANGALLSSKTTFLRKELLRRFVSLCMED